MNTNSLKRSATAARNMLMQGVANRLRAVGFNEDGSLREEPHSVQGAVVMGGKDIDGKVVADPHFLPRWEALRHRIEVHGVKNVVEEAAYTWFNRLIALRILTRNGLAPAVLDYVNPDIRLPRIVTDARAGKTPILSADDRTALDRVILDGRLAFEQFAILIRAVCENNAIIRNCFGGITDYTMLLLPTDILAEGNFIDLLNDADSFISADEWRKPELIGWLYQFYISEKKDEVFTKKGCYNSDEIPAATQIFTPNWIVKYMVENTLGRIYLDNNPGSPLAENWKYLVEPAEPTPADAVLRYSSLEELTCADLSCGSGHILNEMFDLLLQLYTDDFYSPREAIEAIFTKNMVGIDLDIRARQLAQFALLLKACQTDSAFANGHCMPRIYSFPDVDRYTWRDTGGHFNCAYQIQMPNEKVSQEIDKAFILMENADVLGSIMKFDLSDATRGYIKKAVAAFEAEPKYVENFKPLLDAFRIMLTLTDKYAAICMNPPYLGSSKMIKCLKEYATTEYVSAKSDLFAVFFSRAILSVKINGHIGLLSPYVWMFISSFESIRKQILSQNYISNLVQLEYNAFEPACVPVAAFCLVNTTSYGYGTYIRLTDFKGHQNQAPKVLEAISNKHCGWVYYTDQEKFKYIPGSPVAYWSTDKMLEAFESGLTLGTIGTTRKGMYTGLNEKYVRNWFEVSEKDLALNFTKELSELRNNKWYPYANGGNFRRWYGNYWDVVYWQHNGELLRTERNEEGKIRAGCFNLQYIFSKGVVWNSIGSSQNSMRIMCNGSLFSSASNAWFGNNPEWVLGYLNSKITKVFLEIINPTLNANPGDLAIVPIPSIQADIQSIIANCINISKDDWDAHETSWDFESNELIKMDAVEAERIITDRPIPLDSEIANDLRQVDRLRVRMELYMDKWWKKFQQLHSNEEELNRRFIEIYGLQNELKPDVQFDEITILQQGEIRIQKDSNPDLVAQIHPAYRDEVSFNCDVVIKQFISYAIGCMMGRYRLDRPGLAIAHPNPSEEELAEYIVPQTGEKWWIDDDGIVPMLGADSPFHDNAANRFSEFVRVALGNDMHTDNMNFIRESLGKEVVDYLRNDFYADHKRMYQNRPIYWMFSSNQKRKRAAFQCLVYMHRMDRFTPEHIRTNYLLPYIDHLAAREAELMTKPSLTTKESKELKQLRSDLEECRDYQLRLHAFADRQITIDLDDGVVKNYATFAPVLAKLK